MLEPKEGKEAANPKLSVFEWSRGAVPVYMWRKNMAETMRP